MTVDFSILANDTWRDLVRSLGRWRYGSASSIAMVNWAMRALESKWEGLSLSILAGLEDPPNDFEVEHYVDRVMRELGVEQPTGSRLGDLYASVVARDIVDGAITPYDGSKELRRLWFSANFPSHLQPWGYFEDEWELARDGYYGEVPEVEGRILAEARRMIGSST